MSEPLAATVASDPAGAAPLLAHPPGFCRKVPVIVTDTFRHVFWIDAWPGESDADAAAGWVEEPYDIGNLDPAKADDAWRDVSYDPQDPLLQEPMIGPYLDDNCWNRREQERLAQFRHNTRQMGGVIPKRPVETVTTQGASDV